MIPKLRRRQPAGTVLIADDEPHLVRLMQATFRHAGYHVVGTTHSNRVVEKARSAAPDLIVLDVWMPEAHTGCAVLQALNADPLTADIPVILMNRRQAYQEAACLRPKCCHDRQPLPMMPQVSKPFDPAELVSLATSLLSTRGGTER